MENVEKDLLSWLNILGCLNLFFVGLVSFGLVFASSKPEILIVNLVIGFLSVGFSLLLGLKVMENL